MKSNPHWPYGYEKLVSAVRSLVLGKGSLQGRLRDAYIYNLIHIRRENVPTDDMWNEFQEIGEVFQKGPDDGDGTAAGAAARLEDDDAHKLAEKVLYLSYEMSRAYHTGRATDY